MKILILSAGLAYRGPKRASARPRLPMPVAPDVELAYRGLDRGSAGIEVCYDEYIGLVDMMEKGQKAQEEGFDAIVINCFFNPGMEGLRELLDIPIVGAGFAAVHIASLLGDNFSIIDTGPPHWPYAYRIAAAAGLSSKHKSVRTTNLSVAELSADPDATIKRMIEAAVKAVEEDGANVIVFGCTGMRRYAEKIAEEMKKYGVPLVEPLSAAVNVAVALVRLGLSQSKVSYPVPPERKRVF